MQLCHLPVKCMPLEDITMTDKAYTEKQILHFLPYMLGAKIYFKNELKTKQYKKAVEKSRAQSFNAHSS